MSQPKKYRCCHFVQSMRKPMRDIEHRDFENFDEAVEFYRHHKGSCWDGWSYPQEVRE